MSILHPHLSAGVRAMVARIGRAAIPDDEAPTLILEEPRDMASARPLHRIAPACMTDSCSQGRTQCRTPGQCYAPARHESTRVGTDGLDAVVLVVCTAILAAWAAAALIGADWADALRVLASLAGLQ